jgi:hypothetical protein
MTVKLVRSTMERSWSGKFSPMAHAVSRSATVTGSTQGDASSKAVPEPVGGHPAQAVP